ncbi:hypothetical protein [Streptomyces sp. 8L]|uniref:hypothetical protein n=1 Tax=Streptomyces sp. 8L TaxID=2877242 RepID=UPI001CD749F5|nr:hypothetical protein [Streptomyces sp. 8L]MCA1217705.1 hypothetical protein [Streptomyces sp. 8L]
MSETVTRSRRGRFLRFAAAFAALLTVASYIGVQYLTGGPHPTKCSVRAAGTAGGGARATYELTPDQASNAATISAVGVTRGMPERAVTIALATAIQESGLHNLHDGDRDSLGLFQQRPSAGWGTQQQVLDPVYASTQFYKRLAKIPGYERLPLTVAAQQVQRSGFPEAYAKHEPDATLLAAAFTGLAPAVLSCPAPFDHAPGDPRTVRTALTAAFGPKVLPAGSGTDTKHGSVPASASGTTELSASGATHAKTVKARPAVISVPVRAAPGGGHGGTAGTTAAQRGWELAHWAVARAGTLHIDQVAYAGRVWSAADAGAGWQRPGKKSDESDKSSTSEVRISIAP